MKSGAMFVVCCAVVAFFSLSHQALAQTGGMRVGDTFDLRIGGVPTDDAGTISQAYTIDGEGCLNISYLGKLHIAGMTSSQIQSLVERSYVDRGIFTHPTITVSVTQQARFVNVSGAVKNPSRVPYTPDMTVMSAINAASDFNDYANQRKVHLIRGGTAKIIDCKKARRDPSLDEKVLPGDSIQVEESLF